MWAQRELTLGERPRGFHLVTREVVAQLPELQELQVGLLHLHILHTSAGLTLNENASPDVRRDFETWANAYVPEDFAWTHTDEGADDMPAHIKSSLMGASLSLPIARGRLALGTWQGIYLCEARDRGGARRLIATMHGE
ncbi:secondary thiamine-phosphate synthase enzyme YjbQ [Conexibacter woesei]|uniref:secondary thiamine-phosphate synthase enzyme YjbQ n=1 Tax=Conexibacter woesei TaxID=191495 RepID=UPI0003FE5028|nr:secondary thiamine-phosphate synthase enzyme YjbQ [Conexibacter woesei]